MRSPLLRLLCVLSLIAGLAAIPHAADAGIGVGPPTAFATTPPSPANDNDPRVTGTTLTGLIVRLYTNSTCSGPATASGTATTSRFSIAVQVDDDSTTDFYGTQTSGAFTSPCSASHVSYVEDSTPPLVPQITGGPTGRTTDTAPTFTFTDQTSNVTFKCSIDRGTPDFRACSAAGSHTPAALGDAAYTFRVQAMDAAGNTSRTTQNFTVDTTGPVVSITAGPSGGSTSGPNTSFSFSTPDLDLLQFYCTLDASPFAAACTSPFNVSMSAGPHTFTVQGVDTLGNAGPAPSRAWIVDATGPVVSITGGPSGGSTSGPNTSFTFSAPDLDSNHFACKLDAGTFATCTSPHDVNTTTGPHTFTVQGVDTVGNAGSNDSRTWTVDATGPTVAIVGPAKTMSRKPTFTFDSVDSASMVCTLDGVSVPCALTSFKPLKALKFGRHTLEVYGVDQYSNSGLPATKVFKVIRRRR